MVAKTKMATATSAGRTALLPKSEVLLLLLLALVLVLGVMLEDVPESVSAAPLLPDARSSTVRGASAGG